MNVIAYIALRHHLFSQMIPGMRSDDFEIVPFMFQENILKLNPDTLREEYTMLWDYILSSDKFDMVWSYHMPDEIAFEKFKEYNVPVFIQEFFGWYPCRLPSVLPFYCNYKKLYEGITGQTLSKSGNSNPVIVLPLERNLLTEARTIENVLKEYRVDPSSAIVGRPYWNTDKFTSSSFNFMKMIIEIISSCPDLKSCRLLIRPDPMYMENFANEIEFIKKINLPNISLDFQPVKESLENADIIICVNTNYAVDGLRAGVDVITYGNKTFFSNPQLTESPLSPFELESVLKTKVQKIRASGKKGLPFINSLVDDLKGPLACDCEAPYDPAKMKSALKYAFSLPRIEN